MNPIDFLKQNGLNPDNFRTNADRSSLPQFAAEYNSSCLQVKSRARIPEKRVRRRRNLSDVRTDLYHEYFATGNKDLTGLFISWLMADVVNVCNANYLCRRGTFRHQERKHYTALMKSWHHFNQDLIAELDDETKCRVEKMIDDFGDYIYNEVEIFRLNIVGCIMQLDDNFRNLCGALCVCKLMISQARRAWDGMYKSQSLRDDGPTQHLQSMEHHIIELMNHFFKREDKLQEDINLSTFQTVRQAEENVVKKILKFIKEYGNSNKKLP